MTAPPACGLPPGLLSPVVSFSFSVSTMEDILRALGHKKGGVFE